MSGSRKLSQNKFNVVGPAKVIETGVHVRLKPWNNKYDGGWWNEGAVVQQLERPVYTAQIGNPVTHSASDDNFTLTSVSADDYYKCFITALQHADSQTPFLPDYNVSPSNAVIVSTESHGVERTRPATQTDHMTAFVSLNFLPMVVGVAGYVSNVFI